MLIQVVGVVGGVGKGVGHHALLASTQPRYRLIAPPARALLPAVSLLSHYAADAHVIATYAMLSSADAAAAFSTHYAYV